jgi:DNA repair photolyase
MNDPYMPIKKKYNLAGQALEAIADFRFPVHVITKSDLVLKDLDTLERINQVYAAVSFTVTTTDDALAKKLEPGAPLPSARFAAMRVLADHGIHTGVTMMPILPFIEDSKDNIRGIVEQARAAGASYILAGFGMTLRDRQRKYYYDKLDKLFPGMSEKYVKTYGNQYQASVPNWRKLKQVFDEAIYQAKIKPYMPLYSPQAAKQISMFAEN